MGTKKSLFTITTVLCFGIPLAMQAADAQIKQAVAVLHPTQGNKAHGTVRFTQEGNSVKVVAHVEGLSPGQKHAIHVHEFGDCSSTDANSAGSHYNPEKHEHGLPDKDQRHAGDLGNLQADASGKAHLELTVNNITIAGNKNPVIGRAVIVHAKADDGGQPVGNAGARIACGVIGAANTAEKK
jgi:superoxide dismutase, Cu-Zn family